MLCYEKLFIDGNLVNANTVWSSVDSAFGLTSSIVRSMSSIVNQATAGNATPENGGDPSTPTGPPGLRRQGIGLTSLSASGRRKSSQTIEMNDLNAATRTPPQRKSFKTRRSSRSGSESGASGIVSSLTGGLGDLAVIEEADETAMDLLKRGVIVPDLPAKVKWDMFIGALIVFSVIAVPYRLGFDVPGTDSTDVQDLIIDMLFWTDLLLSFRSAYEDSDNDILVTVPKEIARHYMQTWFFVDFFSVFPVAELVELIITKQMPCFYLCSSGDALLLGAGTNATVVAAAAAGSDAGNLGTLKLLKVVRLVRLMKLIRLMKLGAALEKFEEEFNINPAAFELFKLVLQVTFIAHMFGCFFFFVSVQTTPVEESWYARIADAETIGDQYVAALYWAFTTMTTVGYGDITAESVAEKWYSIVIMMLGATVFGYILANIATLMGQLNAREAKVTQNICATDEFLSEKNIGKVLQKNIKTHIRFALSCSSVFDEYSILQKLPTTLGRKLFYHNHRDTLRNICVFNHISQTGVTMYVFAMLHPAQYADGHIIFKEKQTPNDIYFIYSGRAEIWKKAQRPPNSRGSPLPATKSIKCADVKPGEIVGYLGLLAHKTHPHSCVARGALSVYYLNVHDLAGTVYEHPFVAKQLQEALGKSIHEQNEIFRKNAEAERNRKFAEIMMAESNVLDYNEADARAAAGGLELDPRLQAEEATFEVLPEFQTPDSIMTPKYNKEKAKFGFGGAARVVPEVQAVVEEGVEEVESLRDTPVPIMGVPPPFLTQNIVVGGEAGELERPVGGEAGEGEWGKEKRMSLANHRITNLVGLSQTGGSVADLGEMMAAKGMGEGGGKGDGWEVAAEEGKGGAGGAAAVTRGEEAEAVQRGGEENAGAAAKSDEEEAPKEEKAEKEAPKEENAEEEAPKEEKSEEEKIEEAPTTEKAVEVPISSTPPAGSRKE